MTTFKELKERIKEKKKELVKRIRENKKNGERHCYERMEFRRLHIAYCEFIRGKSREKIEQPKDNNQLSAYDESIIENLKAGWKSEVEVNA